ncbi:MAG: ABC transporter permease [Anaerolineales bacterium]
MGVEKTTLKEPRPAVEKKAAALPLAGRAHPSPYASEIIIQPARGWSALRLHELWDYRELLWLMTWRDLQTRYRQMALGPLWIFIQPLISMVLYSIIFGQIARLPSEGKPYALFTYVALLPWGIFTDAVNAGSGALLGSKALLSKVYFPRLLAPISACLGSLVDFAISFLILIALFVYYGQWPTAGIVFIPIFLLMAILTGLAVGIWFAGVIVRYRDFGQVLGIMMRLWMYATPVVYSITLVDQHAPSLSALYRLNPMTGVVEGFRWALLGTSQVPGWPLWVGMAVVVVVLIGGIYNFKRVERNIVDYV